MARKKKHPEHEPHANHERWMLSYADMLTLLLALFIVMFAVSKVDAKKFQEFAAGTAAGFGEGNLVLEGKAGILDGQKKEENTFSQTAAQLISADQALSKVQAKAAQVGREQEELKKVRDQLAKELERKGLKGSVEFQLDERGLVINIVTDKVLFETGDAALRADGTKVLDAVAPSIKKLANRITVEGHTDNVPMGGQYSSNWELSTARATTVLRRMLQDGVPSNRIHAAGYADTKPLSSNATDAGKARNRRVAIVVVASSTESAAELIEMGKPIPMPAPTVAPHVVAPMPAPNADVHAGGAAPDAHAAPGAPAAGGGAGQDHALPGAVPSGSMPQPSAAGGH